jgi:hypothetical protein
MRDSLCHILREFSFGILPTYGFGSEIGREMAGSRTTHSIGFRSGAIWDEVQVCEKRNNRVLSTKHKRVVLVGLARSISTADFRSNVSFQVSLKPGFHRI